MFVLFYLGLMSNTLLAQAPNLLIKATSATSADNSQARGTAVDASGNTYITGFFSGSVAFGSTTLVSAGGFDIFLAKYDDAGTFQWAKRAGGTSSDVAYGVAVSGSNVYITGYIQGTANFNTPSATGSNEITSAGSFDIFLAKYDDAGSFQWAKRAGGTSTDVALGVAVSGSNVYITGYFQGTANFNTPSATGSNELTTVSLNGDVFLARYAATVLPIELLSFSGKNREGGNLLTWATASEVNNKGFEVQRLNGNDWQTLGFVNGNNKASTYTFTDNAPLATSYYRLRQMDNDGKETLSKVISLQSSQKGAVKVFPTITRDVLTVEGAKSFQIINAAGQVVVRGGQEGSGNFQSSPNLSGLPNGIYFVKGVNTEGGVFVEKVVKQ